MPRNAGRTFALLVAAFLLLWVLFALVPMPVALLGTASLVAAALFLSIPVLALYSGAALEWTPGRALALLGGSLLALGALLLLLRGQSLGAPLQAILGGLLQLARLGWPMGLGILIGCMLRDKNLLLPVALVLAAVDIVAVLAPVGTVHRGLESPAVRPVFDALAFQIPKASERPEAGIAQPAAQMGPADPLFLGMFFYAIHRFRMRSRQTLAWMVPALAAYLGVVLFLGGHSVYGFSLAALPALVPIGAVVVAVNWGEFDLRPEEKVMTGVVALVCALAVLAAFTLWREPKEPKPDSTLGWHGDAFGCSHQLHTRCWRVREPASHRVGAAGFRA